ncbi:MAG: FAD:protein FMN transferase [Paracoccaceae bacterium]
MAPPWAAPWQRGALGRSPQHPKIVAQRLPAHEVLDLDAAGRARKHAPITLDLNGIAKRYRVDRLAETRTDFGITSALVGIDGERRALGLRPDGIPWTIAVEAPEQKCRAPHSILALQDAAVATSGDYRHWINVGGRRLSHTMNPHTGAPLLAPPASVTLIAQTCAEADAWATALMVMGVQEGAPLARHRGLAALFLLRDNTDGIRSMSIGRMFSQAADGLAKEGEWSEAGEHEPL